MNLTYKARFYNGQVSNPFVADVSMDETGIEITYHDEKGHYQRILWKKALLVENHFSSAQVILRYGIASSNQQLEVTDQAFLRLYLSLTKRRNNKRYFNQGTLGVVGLLLSGFFAMLLLGYFLILPALANYVADHYPVEYEISMGEKIYTSILSSSNTDRNKTASINHFFKNLTIHSKYPIHIAVIKDTIVNAFALPGGGIIVYDAMLNTLKTPEELAALLAHEYSHVELKHATRNMFRSMAGYFFISCIFNETNSLANLVIDNANQLQNLSYSRELEHEADENGLHILQANRISPAGMIELFTSLQKQNTVDVNEIVSTHPDIKNRILYAEEFAKQNPYTPVTNDSLIFYFDQLKHK